MLKQAAAQLRQAMQAGRYMARGVHQQMVGANYGAYLEHMQRTHPDEAPMSYEAFFRERQDARFNSRVGRCC